MSTGPRLASAQPAARPRMHHAVSALHAGIMRRRTLRISELILTLYVDVITMHGGSVWLGSLVRVLVPLGFSESLVRVSLYRLASTGLLTRTRNGRRSDYRLSPETEKEEGSRAAEGLYAPVREPDWDGRWTLALASANQHKQLSKHGYVRIANGLYANPFPDPRAHEFPAGASGGQVGIAWDAECLPSYAGELRRRLWRAHGVSNLEADYRNLLGCARRVSKLVSSRTLGPIACFQLRLLLIHEYRRLRMQDPGLPKSLLPAKWPGASVHELLPLLYQLLSGGSLDYVRDNLETTEGRLPAPAAEYFKRFGGLRVKRSTPAIA